MRSSSTLRHLCGGTALIGMTPRTLCSSPADHDPARCAKCRSCLARRKWLDPFSTRLLSVTCRKVGFGCVAEYSAASSKAAAHFERVEGLYSHSSSSILSKRQEETFNLFTLMTWLEQLPCRTCTCSVCCCIHSSYGTGVCLRMKHWLFIAAFKLSRACSFNLAPIPSGSMTSGLRDAAAPLLTQFKTTATTNCCGVHVRAPQGRPTRKRPLSKALRPSLTLCEIVNLVEQQE